MERWRIDQAVAACRDSAVLVFNLTTGNMIMQKRNNRKMDCRISNLDFRLLMVPFNRQSSIVNRHFVLALAVVVTCSLTLAQSLTPSQKAEQILKACNVTGGLIVHIGCGNGRLTAALHASDSFVVHGLDRNRSRVALARKYIQAVTTYGPISVDRLRSERLPYADNLVNLVVSEDLGSVPADEIMRVLAPGGTAYIKNGEAWEKTIKRRSDQIDEWTHSMYNAMRNA